MQNPTDAAEFVKSLTEAQAKQLVVTYSFPPPPVPTSLWNPWDWAIWALSMGRRKL